MVLRYDFSWNPDTEFLSIVSHRKIGFKCKKGFVITTYQMKVSKKHFSLSFYAIGNFNKRKFPLNLPTPQLDVQFTLDDVLQDYLSFWTIKFSIEISKKIK